MQLLLGGMAPRNVTVAAAALRPGTAPSSFFAAAWASATVCQQRVELQPWRPTDVACELPSTQQPALLTDRLLIQLAAPSVWPAPRDARELTLCELSVQGLPAAPAA